jgi:hypothetical protein
LASDRVGFDIVLVVRANPNNTVTNYFSPGQHLSNRLCQTDGMKNINRLAVLRTQPQVLASFGRANLVRTAGSAYELRGGSEDELTSAKEWISLFLHEAVLCDSPAAQRRATSNSRW